jgi:hypothetical protein
LISFLTRAFSFFKGIYAVATVYEKLTAIKCTSHSIRTWTRLRLFGWDNSLLLAQHEPRFVSNRNDAFIPLHNSKALTLVGEIWLLIPLTNC